MQVDLEDVKRLTLDPGDTLVLRVPELTMETLHHLTGLLKGVFPDNRVLVLPAGFELEVVEST